MVFRSHFSLHTFTNTTGQMVLVLHQHVSLLVDDDDDFNCLLSEFLRKHFLASINKCAAAKQFLKQVQINLV